MAEIKKAEGFIDWLDQRLAIKLLGRVLLSEYWIPKNINFLWAMGVVLWAHIPPSDAARYRGSSDCRDKSKLCLG